MPQLKTAPKPQVFANAWTKGFAATVREAAGKDGRVSKNEGSKIEGMYADNVRNFFDRTGQKSVGAEKLISSGHRYAEANASLAAGANQRLSLIEARSLPDDLRGDFFALRGKADPGAAKVAAPSVTQVRGVMDAIEDTEAVGLSESGALFRVDNLGSSLAEVKATLTDNSDALWDGDPMLFNEATGPKAVDAFFYDLRDLAEDVLDAIDVDPALAAIGSASALLKEFGDDIVGFTQEASAGRNSYSTNYLVVGASSGNPIVIEAQD